MSSDPPQSYGLHVRKQQQQQQQQQQGGHEEQEEQEQVANNNENRIQQAASNESHQSEATGTKRSYPWPEPAVLQPRLESSTHARSIIGVQSILNPTEGGNSQVDKRLAQDSNNSNNKSTMELLPPPTLPPSPQRRSSSSPLLASTSKSISAKSYLQHGGGSSVSPPHPPRRIITPVSPALRHASVGGNNNIGPGSVGATSNSGSGAGTVTVSQSPFVQELSAGVYSTPGHGRGSSGPTAISVEYSAASRYSPKLAVSASSRNPPSLQLSRHSTPTFHQHSRRLSGGLATNPSSQASSPSTPHSTFSSFAPSPSITSGILPPLGQPTSLPPSAVDSASQSPYMGMDPLSRTPSRMSSSRYGDDPHSIAYPGPNDMLGQAGNHGQYSGGPMIPLTIDLKSGSRSQAEKRKANSDASRRFRNRKKNEAALEQRINQLNEQLQFLTEERDFYRSERDFFRDTLGQHVGTSQMPSRPPSPSPSRRYLQSTASPGDQPSPADSHQAIGMGGEMMSKTMSTGTSSSLASATQRMLPTPASGSDALSYASSAAGQQHPDSWPSVNPPAGNYQHHPYREDVRYMSNMR
ncbi:hypothetical protein TMatcc_008685 [Talaromyces marneffei ATCC 18224]|uniref:BZIP domain-containing protein n=2 Tax=Talaromyces marneffei TaxID=37727 RepID=B6QLB4_TALMQ|nr:uncharacterized protein EYB26_008011 [Talaromyces marneffei]EEA21891.1 conserved hypothetical protein [Talaromyces marneffei ATCC 18224]KAE8550639.1 hypothetical protein EYB25_006867 [Talaromyces marneffei]QGA20309.1 hypothetical protein EYB26_008011 [Talaromyces marneffei]